MTTTSTAQAELAINGGTPVSEAPIPIVSVRVEEADIDAAIRVLRSGMLAQGKIVAAFEQRFAEMTDTKHAVACANGTVALQIAYHALLAPGRAAVVPGWTFIATASMVRARPGLPQFADVCADSFNLDPADAERKITDATQLIVPVHLYGNPAEIDAIDALADRANLKVVYDAAQSHLATYKGRHLGAFGDAVTYSFYPTKNMTTGEGGMVTTNDDALAEELRMIRDHGAKQRYLHETIGFNYRMTDIAAAVGTEQLKRLPDATAKRQANAARLSELLTGVAGVITPSATADATHVYHQYTIRLELDRFSCDRQTFLDALKAEGCSWALHYPRPVHRQPVFERDAEVDCAPLAVCEQLTEEIICLPVHQHLSDKQIAQVAEAVAKVADAFREG